MTNKEAIEELKTRYLTMSQCLDKEELHKANKAIDMAIQALEQEPCEDAISREVTKNALMNRINESIVDCINAIPPVSVAEKVGKWKKIESGDKAFPESIVCSRCGCENSYISEWDEHNNPLSKAFKTTKYCPNCGCKMELWNENI